MEQALFFVCHLEKFRFSCYAVRCRKRARNKETVDDSNRREFGGLLVHIPISALFNYSVNKGNSIIYSN